MAIAPSYEGFGLGDLVGSIELRLTGSTGFGRLTEDIVPEAETYVLVLFDGLGVAQLEHPNATTFRTAHTATLDAPFPTTTSVSLATIATGLPPSQHGQVAHLTWMEEHQTVVNTLKWVTLAGEPVTHPFAGVLPSPNLWERLRAGGVEPITVQPGDFSGSPLSRVLYRGARFEGVWDVDEFVAASAKLAGSPRRLIFTYVPHVDFAGHVFGLDSPELTEAMRIAARVWDGLLAALPPDVALIGTADHGLAQFEDKDKLLIRDRRFDALRFAGDTRGVHLWGEPELIEDLASLTGGELVDPVSLIGPDPTPAALSRLGEKLLLPPDHLAVIPKGFDKRLRCYHGGLSDAEVKVPLLLG